MKKLLNLELRIAYLEKKLKELQLFANYFMTIETTDQRDYIVRTKYIGKLKDKNLIKDFKKSIEETLGDNFDSICNKILNYVDINYLAGVFRSKLNEYELKQIVLDTYGDK